MLVIYNPLVPFGVWITPPTGSMEPAIQDCDLLIYAPGDPNIDDIMMYQDSNGEVIVHRVISKTGDNSYEFKGDNNPDSDGIIDESQIKSEVHYKTGIGIGENTCESIFKPIISAYEKLTGNKIILPEERD